MTYEINNNGLNLPTLEEIKENLTTQYKQTYGVDINVNQNSPDGQLINIKAQNQIDVNEVANYIYNSFDPNIATGRALDRNVAFVGIKRNSGSYTQIPITIIANQIATLQGLDDNYTNPAGTGFTIADNLGNNYILITTSTIQIGNNVLLFRAQNIGEITPILNTINIIATPQLGVVSANNNSAPTQIGINEESDYNLRNRFNQSFQLGSVNNFGGVVSALLSLEGVNSVSGENNPTNITTPAGTAAHSCWLIVDGGNNDDIAETIWKTISSGCGLRGEQSIQVQNVFGLYDTINFDRSTIEELYINITATIKTTENIIDIKYLKQQLVNKLKLKLNQLIDSSTINCLLVNIDNNINYTNIELSKDNTNFTNIIKNTNLNYIFSLNINNIKINGQ